jgi:hypothetical protein
VVIADLTGRNPNVYYELGVTHSFGIPVVILVDAAKSLSFDTSTERVIEIGEGEQLGVAEAEKAKRKLKESLNIVLADDYRPSSLVSEAAGTRSLDALAPDNPIAQELAYVRERLEVVVRQTASAASGRSYKRDAQDLFSLIKLLGDAGHLTTQELDDVGFSLDSISDDNSLRAAVERHIRSAPPLVVDDDIPF